MTLPLRWIYITFTPKMFDYKKKTLFVKPGIPSSACLAPSFPSDVLKMKKVSMQIHI